MKKQSKAQILLPKRLSEPQAYPKMEYEEVLSLIKKECGKELTVQSLHLREKGHKGSIEYKSGFEGDLKIINKFLLPERKSILYCEGV